jgi:predicted RNA-binding protein with PUA-like domain
MRAPKRTTSWEGVRNHQARNLLRDGMKLGDLVFFYHSSVDPPAVMGVCEVVREAYADPTALDRRDPHYDPKSKADAPTWVTVDLRAREALPRPVTLDALRGVPGLERMELLRRGSRLSVQPVTPDEWAIVYRLGMGGGDPD